MPLRIELVAADGTVSTPSAEADVVLVVACGNPLREDDGVGRHALEALRSLAHRAERPPLRLLSAHQLLPEMAEPVSRARGVIFLDARREGTPGDVRCDPITPGAGSGPLAHDLSPETLLLYAETLYGRTPTAVLVTVAGERFGLGERLSPAVRRAIPRVVRAVLSQARALDAAAPRSRAGPSIPT